MVYDLIIIGAGSAGLSASIFASRYKINHLIFDSNPGGQGMLAQDVENYPGFITIKGVALMRKFLGQAKSYGVEIRNENVISLMESKRDELFEVKTENRVYCAKTLILAMGASHRRLGIPQEAELIGRGVSYCSTCDAPFFKDKVVAVVGGGDSALTGALHLALFAKKVYLIHRRNLFRAEPIWIEKVKQNERIEQILTTQIIRVLGKEKVEMVVLDRPYQGKTRLELDGVFIEIGQVPASLLATQLGVEVDKQGYIVTKPSMETNIKGVFAAGDLSVVQGEIPLKQFVTAAADGARAAAGVYNFLRKENPEPSWGK